MKTSNHFTLIIYITFLFHAKPHARDANSTVQTYRSRSRLRISAARLRFQWMPKHECKQYWSRSYITSSKERTRAEWFIDFKWKSWFETTALANRKGRNLEYALSRTSDPGFDIVARIILQINDPGDGYTAWPNHSSERRLAKREEQEQRKMVNRINTGCPACSLAKLAWAFQRKRSQLSNTATPSRRVGKRD